MKITLFASTGMTAAGFDVLRPDGGSTDADHLAEVAGRACYQSWSRPNPDTAATEDYLANVIALGHESVLAHAAASFYWRLSELLGVERPDHGALPDVRSTIACLRALEALPHATLGHAGVDDERPFREQTAGEAGLTKARS